MPMPEACYGICGICGTAVFLADDTEYMVNGGLYWFPRDD
jgi:hypothetical protein